jgi:putative DNA primase/helicase
MTTAQELAQELKFLGPVEAHRHGLGWLTRCPGPVCYQHPDAELSLAISQIGPDVVLRCYGGCSDEDLLYAIPLVGSGAITAEQWLQKEAKLGHRRSQAREDLDRFLMNPQGYASFHTHSDLGNRERLVQLHGERMRFSRALGWMVWTGPRWAPDLTGEVDRMVVDTVRTIYQEAALAEEEKERRALAKHALQSESKGRLHAAVELAKTAPEVVCYGEEFDRNPWLFNCMNGTADLQTGKLHPHRPSDLITQLSPVKYQPDAVCPSWMRFLDEVTQGNPALISFLQRAVGYTLTGDTQEQKFFLCWGEGRNGKGVFLQTLLYLLGDYAKVSRFETFEEINNRSNGPRGDLVALRGKRLVFASENRENMPLAEALIKGVTGNDPITARQLYREEITFTPSFKLWLTCNHLPVIKGSDEAIWERVLFIPWRRYFKPEERDLNLLQKLRQEASGILNWAVQGCLAWQKEGLRPPQEVQAAVREYRREMDPISQFLDRCCILKSGTRAKAKDLYQTYQAFCAEEGIPPQSPKALGSRLAKLGLQDFKSHGERGWSGIGILTNFPPKEVGGQIENE